MSVEFQHASAAEKQTLREYVESVGYTLVTEVSVGLSANDFIFVKNELARTLNDIDVEAAKKLPLWFKDFYDTAQTYVRHT